MEEVVEWLTYHNINHSLLVQDVQEKIEEAGTNNASARG